MSPTPVKPIISNDCSYCVCPNCYTEVDKNKKCGQNIEWSWLNKEEKCYEY